MKKFAFLLKTYRKDADRARVLIESFKKFNVERLHMYIVCPKDDSYVFEDILDDMISIVAEENIDVPIFEKTEGLAAGYLNQEIYKLAFWEMKLCDNYQCLDSDAIFIRNFYLKDFMYDDKVPYTVLTQDKDLYSDSQYREMYGNERLKFIEKIKEEIEFFPEKLLTCHGFQVFSSCVLENFKKNFLIPKGYSYRDVVRISPYEFSWYNLWLQKTKCIPIEICEPNFKTIHIKQHHIAYNLYGITIDDWAASYVGIVLNGNFGIGNGDYSDLSIYDYFTAGIPNKIVKKNYKFYKKLKKNLTKRVVNKIKLVVMR